MTARLAAPLAALTLLLACRSVPAPAPRSAAAAPARPAEAARPPPAAAPARGPSPTTREAVLPSGLRIVVVEHHRRPLVAFRLLLPGGAVADAPESGGSTFLAVALATDFHEKLQDGEELVDEKPLRRLFVDRGGAVDFGVASDRAWLEGSGYARDAKGLLALAADAVVRLRHGSHSFTARRNALLDRIEDLEAWEPAALRDLVAQASFGPGHPYARPSHGTAASLGRLGLEDVIHRQQALFTPRGATLLVVGDVSAEALLRELRATFGRWEGAPLSAPQVAPPAVPLRTAEVAFLRRQPATTLVTCATRPLSDVRGGDEALEVLARLVAGGAGSRLGRAVREGSGLSYMADGGIIRRQHARSFLACAALAAAQGGRGVQVMRDALEAVRQGPVSDAEIERARAGRLAELETGWEDAERILQTWTEALVEGQPSPRPERQREELAAVTPAEVRALAQRVLAPSTLRWLLSGDRQAAARAAETNRLGRLAIDLRR